MELKKEVESLLFSSGKVMSEEELAELTNSSKKDVREVLESLKKDYDERDTSLMLVQTGDSWKLNVREKYMNLVTKIVADTELPFPVLETLAVIAYKAPVLQSEIIKARGTNAYEQIKLLVDEDFVDKKKEGRSFRLSLTPKFFKYFDVAGDKDIKEALKEVKVPEKKVPKKVGGLKVVDIPAEELKKEEEKEKHRLGDLEVVDEEKQVESEEEKVTVEDNKPDESFINDINERIGKLSKRNDELDQDELFKRQEEVNKEMEEEKTEEKEEVKEEEKEEETTETEEKKEEADKPEEKEEETTTEPAEEEKKEE